jgi:phage terminase large subunit-like protein
MYCRPACHAPCGPRTELGCAALRTPARRSECRRATDLASRTDLAALAIVFPTRDPDTGKTRYTAFARCCLNEAAIMEARNPSYPGWAAAGHLAVTPGNETDFDRIESDILELCRRHRVVSIGFDPWQSTQMAQRLRAGGVHMPEFRATTRNSSPAILQLDAALRARDIAATPLPAGLGCSGCREQSGSGGSHGPQGGTVAAG